jgi:phytoene dehydrogenase-like protein
MHVQFTPYTLREGNWDSMRQTVADRAIALVERHLPGFASRIRERVVLAPPDLEAQFGLREGAVSQGEMMLDQILFMRPVASAAHYAMPVPGLYLCGASTHPGGGATGLSGLLAARTVLEAGK